MRTTEVYLMLILSDNFPVCSYSVAIKTGNVKNASTNSNVYFQLYGDRGDTGMIELKQVCDTKSKLQRGSNLRFKLETQDIGNVSIACPIIFVDCFGGRQPEIK